MKYCSKCGYKIQDEEHRLIKRSSTSPKVAEKEAKFNRVVEEEEIQDAEEIETPAEKRSDESEIRIPPGTKVKSKIPKSTTCLMCNTKTEDICFFCNYAICSQHNVNMQVFADKSSFGNVVRSCPECADKKKDRQPTEDEAAEIGFFFNIKPYHEWKILD